MAPLMVRWEAKADLSSGGDTGNTRSILNPRTMAPGVGSSKVATTRAGLVGMVPVAQRGVHSSGRASPQPSNGADSSNGQANSHSGEDSKGPLLAPSASRIVLGTASTTFAPSTTSSHDARTIFQASRSLSHDTHSLSLPLRAPLFAAKAFAACVPPHCGTQALTERSAWGPVHRTKIFDTRQRAT